MSEREQFEKWWDEVGKHYANQKTACRLAWLDARIQAINENLQKLDRKMKSFKPSL